MSRDPEFVDYEPVSRSQLAKSPGTEMPDENWAGINVGKSASVSGQVRSELDVGADSGLPRTTSPQRSVTENQTRETDPSDEGWILKHGHMASFAGLFLFTFVLYFRPYELFPALSWLSSSAFWIAVLTLLVFIPIQLGLENRITVRTREVNLVLLLLVTAVLSVPFAVEPMRAWEGFTDYLKVVLMFIVMVNVVRNETRLKALLLLAVGASLVLSVAAVNDYRLGRLELQGIRISGLIGGMFENPNDLALHLVTMIPLAVTMGLASRSLLRRGLYFCAAVVLVAATVVTFSRGGFFALVCAATFLAWRLSGRSKLLVAMTCVVLASAVMVFAPGEYRSRITTTRDDSALIRQDDLKRSLFVAARNPLFGIGMDNYVLYSNRAKATHNAYTQVAAELGLAASIIYLMFVFIPLKRLRRVEQQFLSARRKPPHYYLAIGLQASLVGYIVASFFASVAFLWYLYYLVAYAICLSRILAGQPSSTGTENAQAPTLRASLQRLAG